MPFGLNNAASTFQRTMELALQGLQWVTCLIYINDIIVFGRNFDEHLGRIEEVFERLQMTGLKLKANKTNMLQTEVVFLGQVVTPDGIKPNPVNVSKILDWPQPKTAKQIKQFVAMGSYYRPYIKNFATIVRPMVDPTKKGKQFVGSELCEEAFKELKRALVSSEVMVYPSNDAGQFYLDVDASDVGIGGILHQMQEGKEKVIAYASRALNKAERNYCITEKELLAVRFFIEYFRQYLLGRKFVVRSDHQALVWLFKLKEPRGKIARWLGILSLYNFSIEYRPGRKQGHCDALSRCEDPQKCECPNQDTEEPLRCGPCKKCLKRAQDMGYKDLVIETELAGDEGSRPQKAQTEITEPHLEEVITEGGQATDETVQKDNSETNIRGIDTDDGQVPGPSTQKESPDRRNTKRDYLAATWVGEKSLADLQKAQSSDLAIGPLLKAKMEGTRPTSQDMATKSPAARHYWVQWDVLEVHNNILFKRFIKKDGSSECLQLMVPCSLKKEMLFQKHDSVISRH